MSKKIMTSIKVPEKIHNQLLHQVISEGYGMRGKSRWIEEAVESFLAYANHPEMVDIASEIEELNEILSVRLSEELAFKLEQAVIKIRKFYPSLEGVKSNIIRASIIQRLLRYSSSF